MTKDKHLLKAETIGKSLQKLLPDKEGENVVLVVESVYGIVQHLIAVGCEERFSEHLNSHVGLPKFLRERKEEKIADFFERLDRFRQGRWYGGKGNGEVVKETLKILEEIKKWSRKKD